MLPWGVRPSPSLVTERLSVASQKNWGLCVNKYQPAAIAKEMYGEKRLLANMLTLEPLWCFYDAESMHYVTFIKDGYIQNHLNGMEGRRGMMRDARDFVWSRRGHETCHNHVISRNTGPLQPSAYGCVLSH